MKQIYIESYYRSGYSRFMKYFNDVPDHPKKETIEQRLEIIKFFDDYGAEATRRAFGKGHSTIFLWKGKLKKSGGKLSALAPGDKTPLRKRKRLVPLFILDFIPKYRADHPGADKTTIAPVLAMACQHAGIKPVSESTVGRIIHDLKEKGRLPKANKITINARFDKLVVREQKPKKKTTRRKGFTPQKPGDLIQMDTISIFADGLKRYINYPKHPQANSYLERFNRTIQEQFADWHTDYLDEPEVFNQMLMEYLIWYNTEKPHRGIGKIPPMCYYLDNFCPLSPSKKPYSYMIL